ncbi:M3 family metallopeptidase [Candidatus Uabimicrobium sp. HlEnr_7]|uniref:M3 family metallopeptidase n=1 Tax=Candidatus Uabimicrobium helgolandensis TaxID=3095367 RepID=UPI003558AC73
MRFCILLILSSVLIAETLIPYNFKPGEMTKQCDQLIINAKKKLDNVVAIHKDKRTFTNTVVAMETILVDLDVESTPAQFVAYVSTNKELREESSQCEQKLSAFGVETSLRKDLYDAFNEYIEHNSEEIANLSAEDARLLETMKTEYRKSGLTLPEKDRNQLQSWQKELSSLESDFSKNLVEDKSVLKLTLAELKGTPESFQSRLKKDEDGKYIVTAKYPDYAPIVRYAENPEVRKRMLYLYYNRAGEKNTILLQKAVALRHQIAGLLGYKNWADYRTDGRMAKNSENVRTFLQGLQGKLAKVNDQDLMNLFAVKKQYDPKAEKLDLWDVGYCSTKLKREKYKIDDELVRQYFPAHRVIEGTFHIYSKLLGVNFEEVKDADVWHESVKLFKVVDAKSKEIVSYFYADLYPREGKYGHAAAFTLRSGRMVDGKYAKPISAIVANLEPPTEGKPSLLSHGNVETFFHEFGHIMHQTLTKVGYASLSGTSVSRDFVEAPSQMLENWVWDNKMLAIISGHYEDESKKLPEDLKQKLLKIKHYNSGINYTRQVFYATIDFHLHTSGKDVDVNALYHKLFKGIVGLDSPKGTKWLAGFGHLMGGYDAGYYGYLWSEVYAQDMFTKFAENGILDSVTGMRYRSIILEKGNLQDPQKLIEQFLERKSNNAAFLQKLGLK